MHFKDSHTLNTYMAKLSEETMSESTVILSFSVGKDSLVAWLVLRRYFKRVIPFFLYRFPHMSFMDKNIAYYEDFFKEKIVQLPHPSFYQQLNNLIFQAPENCKAIEEAGLPDFTYDDIHRIMFEDFEVGKTVFVATGVTGADNMQRRLSIKKNGPVNSKRRVYFPIFDYRKEDLIREIKQAGVKLPSDYRIFGRSFDGTNVQFLEPLKRMYPDDYAKVLEWFPQAELDILRHEWRKEYWDAQAKSKSK